MKDFNIISLPKPYIKEYTPYNSEGFNCETRTKAFTCSNRRTTTIFKVILVGDVSVGKTWIVNRLCRNKFGCGHRTTIGIDLDAESYSVLGWPVTLHIWDTSGQERFKPVIKSYYKGVHAVIVVFDFTNVDSLSQCENWLNDALNKILTKKTPMIFLAGNKIEQLSSEEYENIKNAVVKTVRMLDAEYWPISAKTGLNIELMFARLIGLLFDEYFVKLYRPPPEDGDISKICTEVHVKCVKRKPKKKTLACGCYTS